MPPNRIQPRSWFVEFRLVLSVPPSDADIRLYIIDILDRSNKDGRRIRGLEHVSFAYTPRGNAISLDNMRPEQPDPAGSGLPAGSPAKNVDVIGFVHSKESILDTSMRLWIQDPCVIQQRWTPVPAIKHGGNWMQYEIIKNFFDDCQWGRSIRVDWLWTDIKKGGRPGKLQPPPPIADLAAVRSPPA